MVQKILSKDARAMYESTELGNGVLITKSSELKHCVNPLTENP